MQVLKIKLSHLHNDEWYESVKGGRVFFAVQKNIK